MNKCYYCGRTQETIYCQFGDKAEVICNCCGHCQECKLLTFQHKSEISNDPYKDMKVTYNPAERSYPHYWRD